MHETGPGPGGRVLEASILSINVPQKARSGTESLADASRTGNPHDVHRIFIGCLSDGHEHRSFRRSSSISSASTEPLPRAAPTSPLSHRFCMAFGSAVCFQLAVEPDVRHPGQHVTRFSAGQGLKVSSKFSSSRLTGSCCSFDHCCSKRTCVGSKASCRHSRAL